MLYFLVGIVGIVIGFVLAVIDQRQNLIGKLRHVNDEDGTYFFMELFEPNLGKIISKKYVVLEVDSKSQK